MCAGCTPTASDSTPCKVNSTLLSNGSVNLYDREVDLCSIEGVPVAAENGGTQAAVPVELNTTVACTPDSNACGAIPGYMCDLSTTTSAYCECEAGTGVVTCTRTSSCIRTPCKVCSDCVESLANFTRAQLNRADSERAGIAADFTKTCLASGLWASDRCNATAAWIASSTTPFAFVKRAGRICEALGSCNATALASGTMACEMESPLDLCAAGGGSDVPEDAVDVLPGYANDNPVGMCSVDGDCGSVDKFCDKSVPVNLCSCYNGKDTCRSLGRCRFTPCKRCSNCLSAFGSFVSTTAQALTDGYALSTAFASTCAGVDDDIADSTLCRSASLAIGGSFKGNAGRRASSICRLLGSCGGASTAPGVCKCEFLAMD
jgi:hypothetical protein